MWISIKAYALLWNANNHKGIVKIVLEDESQTEIVLKSTKEFATIADILRSEGAPFFNFKTGSIATGWQQQEVEVSGAMPETDEFVVSPTSSK